MFCKILLNSEENTCAGLSFLVKLQALSLDFIEKRESSTKFVLSFFRSSRPEEFCKIGIFRNFEKNAGKYLRPCLFFNKEYS